MGKKLTGIAKYKYIDKVIQDRINNLDKLMKIMKKGGTDLEIVISLSEIYRSYGEFKLAYYRRTKPVMQNGQACGRVEEIDPYYIQYADDIKYLEKVYKFYDNRKAFDVFESDGKFLLPQADNVDARNIIKAYIYDDECIDMQDFYAKYGLNKQLFSAALTKISKADKELHHMYLKAKTEKEKARRNDPFDRINQMVAGIITGQTADGDEFDVLDFYKLAPFKGKVIDGKDFEMGVRAALVNRPVQLYNWQMTKKNYRKAILKRNKKSTFNYAENLVIFTMSTMGPKHASILKKYMEENNISTITPIFKAATTCRYSLVPEDAEFNKEDAEDVFDIMEASDYPKALEVFNILKEERIAARKDNKKALSYGALKLAAQIYKSPMELEIVEENK